MDESDIQQSLFRYFRARKGYKYQLCNAYVFHWESDFFCIANSGYSYEIEIKRTRGDYFADFKKKRRHKFLSHKSSWLIQKYPNKATSLKLNGNWRPRSGVKFVEVNKVRPNKFIFAVPEGLIKKNEIPDYAGLIYVSPDGRRKPIYIKRPPTIHKEKNDFTKILLDKYYWAYLSSQNQMEAGKTFDFPDNQPKKMRRTR